MQRNAKLRSRQRAASGVAMIGLGVYVAAARAKLTAEAALSHGRGCT